MNICFRNILLILPLLLFTFSCKKESKNEPTPAPISNAVPCNASNLVVDSIIEITGQSKKYKLTIINHTYTPPNGTVSLISGIYQVTMTVLGDTSINSILGKRYTIKSTNNDWDFKAYSYTDPNDSVWRFIPLSSEYEYLFNAAFKLPVIANYTNTILSNNIPYVCTSYTPLCINVNYVNYPVYTILSFPPSSFPDYYERDFYFNKTGLISWSYFHFPIQTQNPYQTAQEFKFEKIN